MKPDERDKLYDWLERGHVDIFLRRLMKERLAELEAALPEDHPLLEYHRPEPLDKDAATRDALRLLGGLTPSAEPESGLSEGVRTYPERFEERMEIIDALTDPADPERSK